MLDALAESVRPADTLTIMFTTGSSGSPKGLCTHASAIGAGFLFYHGRSDDMFKVRGASVYPTEVEQALKTIGGVESALVTSITDDEGDHVAAFVVCDTATMPVGELRRSARAVLSSFKVPTIWLLADSDDAVPRGPTGKVDVRRLREMLAAAPRTKPCPSAHE